MRVLSFAGSLRKDSINKKLAREAVRLLSGHSRARAEYVDLAGHSVPIDDGDHERAQGIPAVVAKLGAHVFPQMMGVANAGAAFDEAGRPTGERAPQVEALLAAFASHIATRVELKAA